MEQTKGPLSSSWLREETMKESQVKTVSFDTDNLPAPEYVNVTARNHQFYPGMRDEFVIWLGYCEPEEFASRQSPRPRTAHRFVMSRGTALNLVHQLAEPLGLRILEVNQVISDDPGEKPPPKEDMQ